MFILLLFVGLALAGPVATSAAAQPLRLILPTSNDALYGDDGSAFYQYTDRNVNGRRSRPWEGGQYGFVRNVRETPHGTIFTRFHEGADIKPVYRDRRGEPLDTVRAIDDGEVVYVNHVAKESNYGLYVVVEHWWGGSPYYSLYAHLNRVDVRTGQHVRQGDRLGRLGYTGRGINRRRAHLHFEINLLLNRNFKPWYDDYHRPNDPNYHRIYNGINLAGIDVPSFYLALQVEPSLDLPTFMKRQPAFFTVAVPNQGMPDLLGRYPWLSPVHHAGAGPYRDVDRFPAWEIAFTCSGLPVRVEPSDRPVAAPTVTMIEPSPIDYRHLTNGLVEGKDGGYTLSANGLRYLDLLTRADAAPEGRMEW